MIECNDSLEYLKTKQDYEFDINYSDPPYALGSEVMIRPDGKVDYKKANDFMSKWEMPTGAYWEQWFKEAYRTLKHGGYLVMFGMDRQLLLFKYYANLAGFTNWCGCEINQEYVDIAIARIEYWTKPEAQRNIFDFIGSEEDARE